MMKHARAMSITAASMSAANKKAVPEPFARAITVIEVPHPAGGGLVL